MFLPWTTTAAATLRSSMRYRSFGAVPNRHSTSTTLLAFRTPQNRITHRVSTLLERHQQPKRYFSRQRDQPQGASALSKEQRKEWQQDQKAKAYLTGGNTVLFLGMATFLLLYVDRYFEKREKECIDKFHMNLCKEFGDLDDMAERYKDYPTLFHCLVRVQSREFKDLLPVRVGDVVDVLEEGVGKGQTFNVCRTRPNNPNEQPVISLYPLASLQKIRLAPSERPPQGGPPSA